MDLFETYLPCLQNIQDKVILVFLKNNVLNLVLLTSKGTLFRKNIHDLEVFKETYGFAFSDKFTVIFLNALRTIRVQLEDTKAHIFLTLAKRMCRIELNLVDCSHYIDIVKCLSVSTKVPDLPTGYPMGPPKLVKETTSQKPKPKTELRFKKRKLKHMSLSRA